MKNVCLDLREHVTKVVNYDKKEMIPLTNEEKNMSQAKKSYICKKRFSTDDGNKKYHKVRDYCNQKKIKRSCSWFV